ncbi:MAG: ABC transporter permease [Vicinamibacterales bacterium]
MNRQMDWRERVAARVPRITGDAARDAEIRDELAQHCADRVAELCRRGLASDAATARVLAELDETARRADRLAQAAAPSLGAARRRVALLAGLRGDLRHAVRLLRRSPGFTLGAGLTLALSIGAVTAIFTVVQAVLLRPLPYPDPGRLVAVWEQSPQGITRNPVSSGNYLDWLDRASAFDALGALGSPAFRAWTGDGRARRARVSSMTASAFTALGVTPLRGRLFGTADDEVGGPPVAVVGEDFWRGALASDPDVIGRALVLDDVRFEVIGVLPRATVVPSSDVDVVVPLRLGPDDREQRRSHNFNVIGRLKAGVTLEAASDAMRGVVAGITAEHPQDMTGWSAAVVPLRDDIVRNVRPMLAVLLGVVVVVLLVACANLATLQLARAGARTAEMGLRTAIGAGRGRLFAQLLVESLLLAAVGGAAGIGLAVVLVRGLLALAPADIPLLDLVTVDWRIAAVSAVLTTVSAVLVGLLPALHASRVDLRPLLHGGSAGGSHPRGRARLMLVGVQVALALVLLAAAGLLARSFWRLNQVDFGYDPRNVLSVELDLPGARYPDNDSHVRFYRDLLDRVRRLPGVVAAAGSTVRTGEGTLMTFSFAIEGRPSGTPTGREAPEPLQAVTPTYFETMRIPVLEGRGFLETDRETGEPVVIINQALRRLHWPDASPIGQRLSFRPGQTPWLTIVGVVGDTHDEGRDQPSPPTVYVPFAQKPPSWSWMTWQTLVVRTEGDPAAVVRGVEAAVGALDADLPLGAVRTVEAAFAERTARRRFATGLVAGFALLALLLGAVGIYGVLACNVAERRREIGIRLALGARPRQVATAVVRPVLIASATGVAAGLVAAVLAGRYLDALLFELQPSDPATLGATAALLFSVSCLAAWMPVRRALGLAPTRTLREG